MPGLTTKLSAKLIGSVLLVFVLTFAVLAWLIERSARQSLIRQVSAELEALRGTRGQFVLSYIDRQRGAARLVAQTASVRRMMEATPPASASAYNQAQEVFDPQALAWMPVFGWEDVLLIARDGTVAYSARKGTELGTNLQRGRFADTPLGDTFRRSLDRAASTLGDLSDYASYEPAGGRLVAFVSAPVPGIDGQPLGVFAVRLSASEIKAIMADYTGLQKTGETYLVGPDLLLRSDSRFERDAALLRRADTEAVHRALNDEVGTVEQLDYRGLRVLSAFAPLSIGRFRWAILAEMDLDEVLVPIRALQMRIVLVFAGASLAGGLVLVLVLRRVVLAPVGALASGAQRVERGRFDQEVHVKGGDELGALAGAMNSMMRSVGRHVTEIDKANRNLHEILNNTPIAVGVSVNGIVRFANPSYQRLFGGTVGEPVAERFVNPADRDHILGGIQTEGVVRDYQGQAYGRDGQVLDVLGTFYLIDFEGQPGVLGWLVDITKLKEVEKLRDGLIHMIVHDLRSPLTGVMGYLDLLRMIGDLAESERRQYLDDAYQASTQMSEMISTLLDVNRLESGQMPIDRRACDVCDVVADALKSLGGLTVGRPVTQLCPNGPVSAVCDPALIRRVVGNLVGNALKFTPATGRVETTVTRTNGSVRVEVTDTGPGIGPADLDHVFDKFSQGQAGRARKQHSSGLGLAFCRLAVTAHGGTIGVHSELGQGSTFWFEIPA